MDKTKNIPLCLRTLIPCIAVVLGIIAGVLIIPLINKPTIKGPFLFTQIDIMAIYEKGYLSGQINELINTDDTVASYEMWLTDSLKMNKMLSKFPTNETPKITLNIPSPF